MITHHPRQTTLDRRAAMRHASVPMKPVRELYDDVLTMSAQGLKPFQIVKRILEAASRSEVMLTGTLNRSELVFRTGEVIAYDGSQWHYRPGEPDEAER